MLDGRDGYVIDGKVRPFEVEQQELPASCHPVETLTQQGAELGILQGLLGARQPIAVQAAFVYAFL